MGVMEGGGEGRRSGCEKEAGCSTSCWSIESTFNSTLHNLTIFSYSSNYVPVHGNSYGEWLVNASLHKYLISEVNATLLSNACILACVCVWICK